METVKLQVELSAAQSAQLAEIGREMQATPENLIVALAFAKMHADVGTEGSIIDQYVTALKSFVVLRHITQLKAENMSEFALMGVSVDGTRA